MSTQNYAPVKNETVSIGDWIVTFILTGIPLVGFIMLIVWAFGSDAPQSKKNWARATLILQVIVTVLVILFYVFIFAAFAASGGYEDLIESFS